MIFLFFGERARGGKDFRVANVNWGFLGKRGIKVEFGGFIGGFGKIFFTKGGDKERRDGVLERWKSEVIFF